MPAKPRWSQEKQDAFAVDVRDGMRMSELMRTYKSSRGALSTRKRSVELEGTKLATHDTALQRHLNYDSDPSKVVSILHDRHPAVTEGRTLFPTRRFYADEAPRLLISGRENRKIGKVIQKGEWAGYPVFTLTLEERATCPRSCVNFTRCMGNGMPYPKRIVADETFEHVLKLEIAAKALAHKNFAIRLHILGDFYSVEYVGLWREMFERFDGLHIWGYTARLPEDRDEKSAAIGNAIQKLKDDFPKRFRMRFSRPEPAPDSTVVITYRPETPVINEGIVCAAERELTACCATCAMCWSESMKEKTIVFMLHGRQKRT